MQVEHLLHLDLFLIHNLIEEEHAGVVHQYIHDNLFLLADVKKRFRCPGHGQVLIKGKDIHPIGLADPFSFLLDGLFLVADHHYGIPPTGQLLCISKTDARAGTGH